MSDIFTKVKCSSYYKPINDGRFINVIDKNNYLCAYCGNGDDIPDECLCDGALEFLKTYYQKRNKHFTGFIVGEKNLTIDGYLIADTDYNIFTGKDFLAIRKEPKTVKKVAIVYFANNRKRYVDLEDLEYSKE